MALLWGGLSLSAIGDQLYAVTLSWIAVGVLGRYAGYLSALQAVCLFVAVTGLSGWADRREHRRSMIQADLLRAAVLGCVVAAWLLSGAPSAAGLVAAVVVLAVGQAVFMPASQAMLPWLVSDESLLPAANGLLDATERSARLLGPGLVGLLAGIIPVVHFLTLDAATFLVSAGGLCLIGRMRPGSPAAAVPQARLRLHRAVWRGVEAMRSHPILRIVLLTTGPLNGAWYATFFLALPLLIEQRGLTGPGGSGLGSYGLVISAYGCTNLLGTVVLGGRPLPQRPQFLLLGGNAVLGVGILVMAASAALLPPGWVLAGLAAGAALGAVGGPMSDITQAVLRQTRLAPDLRAPAMRTKMAANSLGMLLGMLAAPSLVRWSGPAALLGLCGALILACSLAATWSLRHYKEP